MTQNTTKTFATVNLDAILVAGMIDPASARKFASKLEWYAEEVNCLDLHTHGEPQRRLVELEDETEYLHHAANAAKYALLELNRSYKQATGRYIVNGMIQGFDNLTQLLDEIVAM